MAVALGKVLAEMKAAQSDLPLHRTLALIHSKAVAVQLSPVAPVEQFIRGEWSGARRRPAAPALQGGISDQRNKTLCFKKP